VQNTPAAASDRDQGKDTVPSTTYPSLMEAHHLHPELLEKMQFMKVCAKPQQFCQILSNDDD